MTWLEVVEVMTNLGGKIESGPRGIVWGPIRVSSGGGIAGNLDQWWIDFPEFPEIRHLGPFGTKTELRTGLRNLFKDALKVGVGGGK